MSQSDCRVFSENIEGTTVVVDEELFCAKDTSSVSLPPSLRYVASLLCKHCGCHLPPLGKAYLVCLETPSSFPDKHCFCEHKSELYILFVEVESTNKLLTYQTYMI